jgi:AraC-like DNA-binding protein
MMDFPVIMGITSGAAFLLGFLLIFHRRKANLTANRFLGLFVVSLGLAMLEIPLFYRNFHISNPNLFEMIGLSRFLTAPFLYISILHFTSIQKKVDKRILWHFLPFLFFLLFRIPFFITGNNIEFSEEERKIVFFILQTALPIQAIIYWCLSFITLQRHLKNIKQFSSSIENIDLNWLRYFLMIVLVVILVWLNLVFFNLKDLIRFTPYLYMSAIFFLAHFSLQQKEIFDFSQTELVEIANVKSNKKESQKRVSETRLTELNNKLKQLIYTEKVYLDNDLSLPKLSKKLEASYNETSFLINELYHDNFYNFINKYRIEEAKTLLLSEKYSQLNILGIAYESGFSSKTTFNTTFKKYVGLSPTEFVKTNTVLIKKEM